MDAPDTQTDYLAREVLKEFKQSNGVTVQIIRYTWKPALAQRYGYSRCIRIRRSFEEAPLGWRIESVGVPEHDWPSLVQAINEVKV
jgi:hypothetical protein